MARTRRPPRACQHAHDPNRALPSKQQDVECAHAEHEASNAADDGGAALLRVIGIVREHTAAAERGSERAIRRLCRAYVALALRIAFPERAAHNPCFRRLPNGAVEWLSAPAWWPKRACHARDGTGARAGDPHLFRGTFAFDAPIEEVHALVSRLWLSCVTGLIVLFVTGLISRLNIFSSGICGRCCWCA